MLSGILENKFVLAGIILAVTVTAVTLQRLNRQEQTIPFHTIYYGQGGQGGGFSVINDNNTWVQVWTEALQSSIGGPAIRPVPRINFSERSVIVAFLGQRPTAGYQLNITALTLHGSSLNVKIETIVAGSHCAVAQMPTSWMHIVDIPKWKNPVVFNNSTLVTNC